MPRPVILGGCSTSPSPASLGQRRQASVRCAHLAPPPRTQLQPPRPASCRPRHASRTEHSRAQAPRPQCCVHCPTGPVNPLESVITAPLSRTTPMLKAWTRPSHGHSQEGPSMVAGSHTCPLPQQTMLPPELPRARSGSVLATCGQPARSPASSWGEPRVLAQSQRAVSGYT